MLALGDQISSLELPGVNVDREDRREMPGGETGRSIIGKTNIDGEGIAGLELQYDDMLSGTGGEMSREVAPGNRSIPGTETVTEAPIPGNDLVLTLDRSIQFSTEQVLLERVSEIGARGATAIVMSPHTGDILAMASVRRNDETGQYEVTSGNYAAVDAYEPGSVAKVITDLQCAQRRSRHARHLLRGAMAQAVLRRPADGRRAASRPRRCRSPRS